MDLQNTSENSIGELKNNKWFLVFAFPVVVVLVFFCWHFFSGQENGDALSPSPGTSTDTAVTIPEDFNSTQNGVQAVVSKMDNALKQGDLSPRERIQLLTERGYFVLITRANNDSQLTEAFNQSLASFDEAHKIIQANPELENELSARVKFGYLYTFVTGGFYRPVVRGLPFDIRPYFKDVTPYDSKNRAIVLEHQLRSFRAIVDFAYTDPHLSVSDDRSIVSHRMFTTATFLLSFYDSLPVDERRTLLARIGSDLERYPLTSFTIFTTDGQANRIKGVLLSEYQRAFTNDVYFWFSQKSDSPLLNEAVFASSPDSLYDSVRQALKDSHEADKISLGILSALNDENQISSLYRRVDYTSNTSALYATATKSLIETLSNSDVQEQMIGHYNYLASNNSSWMPQRELFFGAIQKSDSLRELFKKLNFVIPDEFRLK